MQSLPFCRLSGRQWPTKRSISGTVSGLADATSCCTISLPSQADNHEQQFTTVRPLATFMRRRVESCSKVAVFSTVSTSTQSQQRSNQACAIRRAPRTARSESPWLNAGQQQQSEPAPAPTSCKSIPVRMCKCTLTPSLTRLLLAAGR